MKEEPMMEEQTMTMEEMPFGGDDDVAYANTLWEKMEMGEFNSMPAHLQPGETPHGAVIEILEGKIDDQSVIVKRNYGGEGVSVEAVEADRAKFLAAITVMAKREEGYDSDNSDWFWVKYLPDGGIAKNPKEMALAGRVAKGMDTGCISCHLTAIATDMVFAHDEDSGLKVKMLE
ncbi:MAG: cytochrome P460 family protein [bacterium]|nr:cytochrome P460 family protein [bacterium]